MKLMNNKTIITIGSGYSGSSAIYEYFQKTKLFFDPYPNTELSITYDPGGLLDIENLIKNNFSINQNQHVYKNFRNNIKFYISKDKGIRAGKNLKFHFQDIEKALEIFLKNITDVNYKGETLLTSFNKPFLSSFIDKIFFKYSFIKKKKYIKGNSILFKDLENFYEEVNTLLNKMIYNRNFDKKNVILDQAGTIFNPIESTKFYENSRPICILRDPRDIFAEFINKGPAYPGYDVLIFCKWYKSIIKKIKDIDNSNEKVLFIWFEDFVLKNEETLEKIFNFISMQSPDTTNVKFNFERSRNNIFKYKKLSNLDDIKIIEKNLYENFYINK